MKNFGPFLTNLRSSAGLSQETLAKLAHSYKSEISKLETNSIPQPFSAKKRKLIITLAEILCTSKPEIKQYLKLAEIDLELLTEAEQIQVGFAPVIPYESAEEIISLERLLGIYRQLLAELETKKTILEDNRQLPNLDLKILEYTTTMQEIQKRLNKLYQQRELRSRSFDPHPNLYSSYSHLQKDVESNGMTLKTAKYLRLTADELIERYSQEKPLSIKVNELEWKLPHTCIFDNTLQQLSLSNIVVEQDRISPQYIIPTRLETKASDVLEEIGDFFHDSTTIRLNQVIQDIDKLTLVVSKAHYLDYIATNYAMDALLVERGWTKSLRDIINPGKRLEPLETSLLANHIGVSVLIITSDNYLILPIRSHEKVGIWHKQVMPSISGAASYDEDMWSTRKGPVAAWMREGREELGLENSNFEEPSIFLGTTREFLRGGKPELFFTTHITLTKTKLEQKFHKARDKWENKELRWFEFSVPLTPLSTEDERQMFLDDFLRLMKQYQNTLSQSLQANLALWFKYIMSL